MATLRVPAGTPLPSVADFAGMGTIMMPGALGGAARTIKALLARRRLGSMSGPTEGLRRFRGMRVNDVPPLSAADRAEMFRPRSMDEAKRLALLEQIRLKSGGH